MSILRKTVKTDRKLIEFFSKPHTLSLLVLLISVLIYHAFNMPSNPYKSALFSSFLVFNVIGMLQFTDSIFKRPIAILWRCVKASSIYYLVILVLMFYFEKEDMRRALSYFYTELNVPLPQRSYATHCEINMRNVINQIDVFVPLHIFGWFFKTLLLRDRTICWILSVLFEFAEYSLQHQLDNFAECWWDHWILDVLTCNFLGIEMGMLFIKRMRVKRYEFIKLCNSLKRYVAIITLIAFILAAELNVFYLKFLLYIPTEHNINLYRLLIFVPGGALAVREAFEYYATSEKIVRGQLWLSMAIVCVETMVVVKYSRGVFVRPFPRVVVMGWCAGIFVIVLGGLFFFLKNNKIRG
ncbi:hypothetical protein VCUG_01522 [Vavraia culicis subsp. floridensis]|uniref:Phosphatidylserine synthase n=1 Tax=Vavraia culicis (isolate floridensis) TaxID=948595 RepID=L2GTK1_VAVCU|nr:uncharacterized protein VCUG_01522 [Vavraia culicis subsp. floridensis]ELA46991.1 hypothetical protein VCUG_01522 [Vavraia culicis subsp. floridensis]